MGRPRSFEAEAAAAALLQAFWAAGYDATSLTDLEQATGLSRSSLYQAFGDKRALFEAALESYRRQVVDPVLAALERADAGPEQVHDYLAVVTAVLRGDPELARQGCVIVNAMTELGSRDEGVRAEAVAYRCRIEAAIANGLRRTGPGAPALARTITATMVGVLVLSRVEPDHAAAVLEGLHDLIPGPQVGAP